MAGDVPSVGANVTPPQTESGGDDAGFAELQGIFDKAAADQRQITKISVEGNTEIAKFKEKPKI